MLRATFTLLTGGALAQLVPLLLGPVLARLFSPEAFGLFTAFATIAASVAVVACARYEYALPMAHDDAEAAAWQRLMRSMKRAASPSARIWPRWRKATR